MSFENKVCVITGGANGIGLCIAGEFAKEGSKVAIIDLDQPAGEKALASIKACGYEGLFFCGDIAEKATLESFANEVIKTYGRIDYLINNACLSRKGHSISLKTTLTISSLLAQSIHGRKWS